MPRGSKPCRLIEFFQNRRRSLPCIIQASQSPTAITPVHPKPFSCPGTSLSRLCTKVRHATVQIHSIRKLFSPCLPINANAASERLKSYPEGFAPTIPELSLGTNKGGKLQAAAEVIAQGYCCLLPAFLTDICNSNHIVREQRKTDGPIGVCGPWVGLDKTAIGCAAHASARKYFAKQAMCAPPEAAPLDVPRCLATPERFWLRAGPRMADRASTKESQHGDGAMLKITQSGNTECLCCIRCSVTPH